MNDGAKIDITATFVVQHKIEQTTNVSMIINRNVIFVFCVWAFRLVAWYCDLKSFDVNQGIFVKSNNIYRIVCSNGKTIINCFYWLCSVTAIVYL